MRRLLALAVFPLFGAAYPQTLFYDGMPPDRLRDSPVASVRVVFGHLDGCGRPNSPDHPNAFFASCIRRDGVIYLPNPCAYGDREEFARLACHEQAHLEGWPADHGE